MESETKSVPVAALSSGSFETVFGSPQIIGLRWSKLGKLQCCREEKWERWENGFRVESGYRESWEDVGFESPNAPAQPRREGGVE